MKYIITFENSVIDPMMVALPRHIIKYTAVFLFSIIFWDSIESQTMVSVIVQTNKTISYNEILVNKSPSTFANNNFKNLSNTDAYDFHFTFEGSNGRTRFTHWEDFDNPITTGSSYILKDKMGKLTPFLNNNTGKTPHIWIDKDHKVISSIPDPNAFILMCIGILSLFGLKSKYNEKR